MKTQGCCDNEKVSPNAFKQVNLPLMHRKEYIVKSYSQKVYKLILKYYASIYIFNTEEAKQNTELLLEEGNDFLIFIACNTAFQQGVKVNVAFLVITELFETICSRDEEKNQRL